MLIGSEKTPLLAFLVSYIKFTSEATTPTAAKVRSAQVLRNSPRAMPLTGYELQKNPCPFTFLHAHFFYVIWAGLS